MLLVVSKISSDAQLASAFLRVLSFLGLPIVWFEWLAGFWQADSFTMITTFLDRQTLLLQGVEVMRPHLFITM